MIFGNRIILILVTKTQLEGTSPHVDNGVCVRPRKIWRQFREVKRFSVFCSRANKLSLAKRAGVVAREASKLSLAKRAGAWWAFSNVDNRIAVDIPKDFPLPRPPVTTPLPYFYSRMLKGFMPQILIFC